MKFRQKSISPNDVRHHQAGLTLLELIISIFRCPISQPMMMCIISENSIRLLSEYSNEINDANAA
ncbi:MAG: hypothetical protein ACD_23C00964G0009 [uncultured bacterium]|nr:MAG: hypothetical protein ACD_23C00964G0009 [uncultured bacterium]